MVHCHITDIPFCVPSSVSVAAAPRSSFRNQKNSLISGFNMAEVDSRDLPFRAEYAKSSRAGCKGCRTSIMKESLRLAKMVQSPMFDGKIPNWYHYHCFFKKNKPTTETDIGGLAGLRWDDQQKIKDAIGGKPSAGSGKSADPDANKSSKKADMCLDLFQVGYASSNRSKCRKCGEKIDSGVVRIAHLEMVEEINQQVPRWHHTDCFIDEKYLTDSMDEWPPNGTASMLTDYSSLKPADRKMLDGKFAKVFPQAKANGKGKGKGKAKGDTSNPPPAKKAAPTLSQLELDLKAQSDALWSIRDKLYREVGNNGLKEMLEENDQDIPPGESRLLDTVADGMLFGALKRCPECKDGQLILSSTGLAFRCTGNLTSWTKCQYRTQDVKRNKTWLIPQDLKEDIPFLKKFKFKPLNKGKRVFPAAEEPSSSASQKEVGDGKRKIAKKPEEKPLHNCIIVLVGKMKKTNKQLKEEIQELGGETASKIADNTACVISTETEVKKNNKKIQEAKTRGIHVVSEEFLDAVKNGGAALMITQHSICDWGSDPSSRIEEAEVSKVPTKSIGQIQRERDESRFASILPKSSKMRLKGGAVVDPDSGKEDIAHVFKEGSKMFSATLGLVDISRGTNSYYKIQLLEHDKNKLYWVFRSWGRVGTTIGGNKTDGFSSNLQNAKEAFRNLYLEKTGNTFGTKNFVKHPMKFFPLDISYGEEEDRIRSTEERAGKTSKLPIQIQELMRMIFDLEQLKKTMLEFEIDLDKMPLGKLSKKQIEDAYRVLTELQQLVSDKASATAILDASNRFYTLIPHNFGLKSIPLLDSPDLIQTKTQMLDNLLDIEIAYAMLKDTDETKDPIDAHYEKLKCPMTVVDKKSDEFKLISEYTENTHAATHNWYRLSVEEVFRLDREGEAQRFKPFRQLHNRQLLWHGSRRTNFGGILSQGLRIAPPEAPVTGYMFGKGLYFADMVTKSANYCYANASNNIGLMILSDVALGDMYELTGARGMSKPPKGKHSTKGMGRTTPDPKGFRTIEDNLLVPMGRGINSDIKSSSLLYNEYIVYDVAQVQMRYLIKMKFNYNV